MLNTLIYLVGAIGCYYQLFLDTRYYRVKKSKFTYTAEMKRHFFTRWVTISEKQSTAEGALIYIRRDIIMHLSNDSRWFNRKINILPTKYTRVKLFKLLP